MADPYQRGTDDQWLKQSNEELELAVKRRERTIWFLRFCIAVLLVALGWVVFCFSRHASLQELWSFK